jgi:hypothetical protein
MPSEVAVIDARGVEKGSAPEGEAPAVRPESPGGPRKPYRAPRLECHGTLVDLTALGGSQAIDSGGGLGQQL